MGIANWSVRVGLVAAFGVMATGCVIREASYRERREPIVVQPGYAPQPVYVEPAPPPPEPIIVYQEPPRQEMVLVVHRAPPPLRQEARLRMPGQGFVWISGNWVVQRNQWVWVAGRWERPPRANAHWEPHRWENHGGEFRLTIGGWR